MTELSGKAIIITGASSGIGRVTAVTLGRAGADLWLVGRSEEELRHTADLATAAGGATINIAPIDLRERGRLAALIEGVGAEHPHLFAIINNAGVMYPEPILRGTIERWQAMFDINVMAMLEGSKTGIEVMRRHGRPGHVVNIGSLQGRFEVPGVYGISKKAAEMITATLRAEVEEDNIRIAAVIPGGFQTQLARGFHEEEIERVHAGIAKLNQDAEAPDLSRVLGDPQHIADGIYYILTRPANINIQEMLIRPPVDMRL